MADMQDIINSGDMADGNDLRSKTDKAVGRLISRFSGADESRKIVKRVLNNVIVFMGASGGAGASTLVATEAVAMKEKGLTVAVVDLGIMFPSQHIYFDLDQSIGKADLVSYLSGNNGLNVSLEYSDVLFNNEATGVATLTACNRTLRDYVVIDSSNDAVQALTEALNRLSSLFDVVLIDCKLDLSSMLVQTTLFRADNIYLVMDDGVQSLINVSKLRANLDDSGINTNKVRYIMNKRKSFYYAENNLKALGIELIGILPFEMGVVECGLRGQLFTVSGKNTSKTSPKYLEAVDSLTASILEIGGYTE